MAFDDDECLLMIEKKEAWLDQLGAIWLETVQV
jgi:hypothetical protein